MMPRMPGGFGDPLQMMKAQSEFMAELPATIADLQKTVRGLAEAIDGVKESVAAAQRVSARVESVLDDMEAPVRALRPGIERLAAALDDPIIDRIPITLAALDDAVTPVTERLARARRWAAPMGEPRDDQRARVYRLLHR